MTSLPTPLLKHQWWSIKVWPKWLKKQLDTAVSTYSRAVLSFLEDEITPMFALMSLILLGCLVVPTAYVILLALIGLGVFNAMSYYFIHDKTQEEGLRVAATWMFRISAATVLIIAPVLSVVQIVWLIVFR